MSEMLMISISSAASVAVTLAVVLGIQRIRRDAAGAIAGGIAGFIATAGSWALNFYDVIKINFMWYAVFGLIATCGVGYVISLLTFSKERKLQK